MVFELDDKELDYVFQVLGTRPYAEVAPLIGKISLQVQQQQVEEKIEKPDKPHVVG